MGRTWKDQRSFYLSIREIKVIYQLHPPNLQTLTDMVVSYYGDDHVSIQK